MGGSVKSPPFFAHIRTLAFILLLKICLLYLGFKKLSGRNMNLYFTVLI